MAGLARKLFVNWHKKSLQLSDESESPVQPPIFQKYETVPLEVVIVEPCDPWGHDDFRRIDITGVSLTVSINDTLDDATPLASQSSWTKDTSRNTFTGELSLNNSGMNTYIGSAATKAAYLEIEVREGASATVKIYSAEITLKGSVVQLTSTAPSPAAEYLTRAQMEGLFVQFRNGAGKTITLVSPDGSTQRVIGANDDGTGQDDYLPN